MNTRSATSSSGASADAIREILDQERRAREELQACLLEADAMRDRAREQARRIEARADRRVERVHEAGDRLIAAGIRRIEVQMRERQRTVAADLPAPEIWEQAVERAARHVAGLARISHKADPRRE